MKDRATLDYPEMTHTQSSESQLVLKDRTLGSLSLIKEHTFFDNDPLSASLNYEQAAN